MNSSVDFWNRSGAAVAMAGSVWGGSGPADDRAAGVHAPLPQKAPLSRPGGEGEEGPPLAEGRSL